MHCADDAPRSHHAGLAAALPLLLSGLRRCGRLASLDLNLPALSRSPDNARVQAVWTGAWNHTLPVLRDLLGSAAQLREVGLSLDVSLRPATVLYEPQLCEAAAAAPVAVRAHLLLALHPRVGRGSLLQLLPLAVFREVLDLAAPLEPCRILDLYTLMPVGV